MSVKTRYGETAANARRYVIAGASQGWLQIRAELYRHELLWRSRMTSRLFPEFNRDLPKGSTDVPKRFYRVLPSAEATFLVALSYRPNSVKRERRKIRHLTLCALVAVAPPSLVLSARVACAGFCRPRAWAWQNRSIMSRASLARL
jgi:hypothetical protein